MKGDERSAFVMIRTRFAQRVVLVISGACVACFMTIRFRNCLILAFHIEAESPLSPSNSHCNFTCANLDRYPIPIRHILWSIRHILWSMDTEFVRCRTCEGTLRVETATDVRTGLTVEQFVCTNCGQRWCSECAKVRPMAVAN